MTKLKFEQRPWFPLLLYYFLKHKCQPPGGGSELLFVCELDLDVMLIEVTLTQLTYGFQHLKIRLNPLLSASFATSATRTVIIKLQLSIHTNSDNQTSAINACRSICSTHLSQPGPAECAKRLNPPTTACGESVFEIVELVPA